MKINKVIIRGFKKFSEIEIEFNDDYSVLIGDNESGKSTILSAIDIVLNQMFFQRNESSLSRYINKEMANYFFNNPSVDTLPSIEIELFIDMQRIPKEAMFNGLHYSNHNNQLETGIKFKYEFNREFQNQIDLIDFASHKILPIEFYNASWTTFQGKSYVRKMMPLKFIHLDNSTRKNDLFGNYAKNIYESKVTEQDSMYLSADFNKVLSRFVDNHIKELSINDGKNIGFDANKTEISRILDIYENEISLKDMGKGKENIVRTELAISNNLFDLILIDEPESHLSYANTRKLVEEIKAVSNAQIIIASHSSLIVSRLNLKNTLFVSGNNISSLQSLSDDTNNYFKKSDNLDILRFIVAEKVILVEGTAEYIVIPAIYKKIFNEDLEKDNIDIISMGSISYKRYFEVNSNLKGKKVLVFTDNDKKEDNNFEETSHFKVFTDASIENWTLEVAFYNINKKFFDEEYKEKRTVPTYNNESMELAKAHMLKNKTENALVIEEKIDEITIPEYIREGLKWIRE